MCCHPPTLLILLLTDAEHAALHAVKYIRPTAVEDDLKGRRVSKDLNMKVRERFGDCVSHRCTHYAEGTYIQRCTCVRVCVCAYVRMPLAKFTARCAPCIHSAHRRYRPLMLRATMAHRIVWWLCVYVPVANWQMGAAGILAAVISAEPASKQFGLSLPGGVPLDEYDEFHELIMSEEFKRLGCYGLADGLLGGISIGQCVSVCCVVAWRHRCVAAAKCTLTEYVAAAKCTLTECGCWRRAGVGL